VWALIITFHSLSLLLQTRLLFSGIISITFLTE
jgi:hypothetical protein